MEKIMEKVGMILGGIGSSKHDKYIVYREEKSASKIFKASEILVI